MKEDGTIQPAKVTHFTMQGYVIRGVIHAGANDFEEAYSYKQLGIKNILGFEPLPSAVKKCRSDHPDIDVIEMALGGKNGKAELLVTKGDGKGSSIFEPILESEEVKKNWIDNGIIVGKRKIGVIRLDTFFEKSQDHYIEDYDCLVLDVQGVEWEVLHGCGELLKQFKFLSIELSETPVYKGEHSAQKVIDYLVTQGFTQDSPIQSHNDVFFVRSDIKPTSDLVYRGLG